VPSTTINNTEEEEEEEEEEGPFAGQSSTVTLSGFRTANLINTI
jgi:hypothetical protein